MEIVFILVQPDLPENVGAAARAMKTMGFESLRLVNPCDHLCDRALWMAHGSQDILTGACVFEDLRSAIQDLDFIVGTTSKRRLIKDHYHSLESLRELIVSKSGFVKKTGLVFGRESRGLSTRELQICDVVTTLPMKNRYPSLNLSQAVMIYAYGLSSIFTQSTDLLPPDAGQMRVLKEKITRILKELGIGQETKIFSRLMERIGCLCDEDIRLLHWIVRKLNETMGVSE